ncbi:PTS fructose transporter subunit IIC [Candidatus Epulonipiscium viviparus]|uniref:PTS fructose transporter subunit IIC n=1 Tax=Candidatus Epulonipiscium viviparus TaxID=420336 RepID=UPI00016C007D|nr:PTS fructose transporter subunit IIC [Candidatus Epulopiscium viviparus]
MLKETIKDVFDEMKRAMYNGLSYMIPLVAGGGILIAIGTFLYMFMGKDMLEFSTYMYEQETGYLTTAGFMSITWAEVDRLIFWIGKMGFSFIPEFMAMFTAYSLVGKPGIAPAFILGRLANLMSGNFIGGIVVGWLVGYLVKFTIRYMTLKGGLRTITSFIFIPIMATMIGGIIYRFTIGIGLYEIMNALTSFLNGMHQNPEHRIILALIMGAMVVSDLGGPIGKVSVLFGLGVISTDLYPHTFNHIAVPTSGSVIILGYLLNRKYFNANARQAAINNQINCLFTVTEGGLPFLFARPGILLPATMTAGAVASSLVALFEIQLVVPLGFWLAIPFVNIGNAPGATLKWCFAFIAGVAIGTAIFTILIRKASKKLSEDEYLFLDEGTGFSL